MYLPLVYGYILYFLYNITTTYIYKKNTITDKIIINNISAIHCYISLFFMSMYFYSGKNEYKNNCLTFASSYYIYDTMRIVNIGEKSLSSYVFIYHHILSTYVLNSNLKYSFITYCSAEISNIFYFPVYFLKKKFKNNFKILHIFQYMQAISYILIRCFVFSYIYYRSLITHSYYINTIAFPIYLMGLVWSYKLYKDCIKIIISNRVKSLLQKL